MHTLLTGTWEVMCYTFDEEAVLYKMAYSYRIGLPPWKAVGLCAVFVVDGSGGGVLLLLLLLYVRARVCVCVCV